MSEDKVIQLSKKLNVALINPTPGDLPDTYPELSQSIATVLENESPLHAWGAHPLLGGIRRKTSGSMDFGSICHEILLGKGNQVVVVPGFDDWRKGDAKKRRDEIRRAGRIPVLQREAERAHAVTEILRVKLARLGVEFRGVVEQRIRWVERAKSGRAVKCAGTPDHALVEGGVCTIDDLKTTASAHPDKFKRSMISFGYDIQWAAYTRGCDQAYNAGGRVRMRFIACEVEWPFSVTVAYPAGTMRALGTQRWLNAVETWDRCVHTNTWPEYSSKPVGIEAPMWMLHQAAEESENDDEEV